MTPRDDNMDVRQREVYIVFYDAACAMCHRIRRWLEWLGADRPMRFVDVNDREALSNWPQIDPGRAQDEVFVLDPGGQLAGGYDAVVVLAAATIPGVRPLVPLLRLRAAQWMGERLYHWTSVNRYWISRRLFERKQCRSAASGP